MTASIRRARTSRWPSLCIATGFIALAACGGESKAPAAESASAPPAAAVPTAETPSSVAAPSAPVAITGTTHDVRMVGDEKGYRFEPATITIKAGDGVRWTMVSGPPHNVSFWSDSIPSGAAATLTGAMTNPMSPLVGPLLLQPNETYTISFEDAPKGTYHYFCTPHLALGMKATIVVR